jgi:hypothetical protein
MDTAAERRAKNDKRVADDVQRYGCHVISVFDPEQKEPCFSYSVGIQETSGAPEAIVIGLRPELGGFIINEYNRQVRSGRKFRRGVPYPKFLRGFSVYIEPVLGRRNAEYTYGCDRYYKDAPYAVVQIIYPNTSGVWPWSRAADAWFESNQPMLGRVRPNRP